MAKKSNKEKTNNKKNEKLNDKKIDTSKKVDKNSPKKEVSKTHVDNEIIRFLRVVLIVLIIFVAFYFLTILITNQSLTSDEDDDTETEFNYTETLVGRSFSLPEDDYVILYYDKSDNELYEYYSNLVTEYRSADATHVLYVADMGSGFNKNYISGVGNSTPTSASDILINGPTLIHFVDHQVVEYFEGQDDITNYLS